MNLQDIQKQLTRAGLQERDAQIAMIKAVHDALKQQNILCIEAPTGTGKTISYCIASYHARAHKQPIVISTATIALQEQLFHKDLPLLAEILGEEIKYVMAKGRRRYVCLSRLYGPEAQMDLFAADEHMEKLRELVDKRDWNGDRDQLDFTVPDEDWQRISTDRAGCSGRLCEMFEECLYYKARKKMHVSDFIIANHSLLLSDLELGGGAVLPPPEENIYIIDECHHLPEKALDHFAKASSVMGSIEWINNINRTVTKVVQAGIGDKNLTEKVSRSTHELVTALKQMQEYLLANYNQFDENEWRIDEIEPYLLTLAKAVLAESSSVRIHCEILVELLEKKIETSESGNSKDALSKLLNNLSFLQGRAVNANETWTLFCHQRAEKEAPIARWFEKHSNPHREAEWSETFLCHCSPINVSQQLKTFLWDKLSNGTILCSATIRALGKFEDFRRKAGLKDDKRLKEQHIDSFFDYSKSLLYIPKMQYEPTGNNQEPHRQEVIQLLPELILPKSGTLVLFTSRAAMESTYAQMPDNLKDDILVQGSKSKNKLIETHKQRIRRGRRSILFGLASFGEGLDLPADFCQHVIIHKLPFAVPSTPIERTRNEWLEQNKRNPFMLSTLPATSIKLTQFVGRLLRQESDMGIVTVLDKRLYSKFYGKDLLNNLPGFTRLVNCDIATLKKNAIVAKLFELEKEIA